MKRGYLYNITDQAEKYALSLVQAECIRLTSILMIDKLVKNQEIESQKQKFIIH